MRATTLAALIVAMGCSSGDGPATATADSGTTDTSAADSVSAPDTSAIDTMPRPSACPRKSRNVTIPSACNGSPALCDRRFDQVTFPMTHNAMSNADDTWTSPNQQNGIAKQLQDGVRGMMLDTYYFTATSGTSKTRIAGVELNEQAHFCHVLCELGKRKMLDGLCDIVDFLDRNRGEIFSIIFESNVSDADTAKLIEDSGLSDYVFTYKGGTWPTLKEMIAKDTRLVLFTESGGGTPAWYHPAWSVVWDTPYVFPSASSFSCALNRGAKTNSLFLVNHWLNDAASGDRAARAAVVNTKDVLGSRVQTCTTEAGRVPTFVGVDYHNVGALFDVVRTANKL